MSSTVKALVFLPGQCVEVRDIEPELSVLQQIVGGYLELIQLGTWAHMYVNEAGMFAPMAANTGAALLIARYQAMQMVIGPAVVLGSRSDGSEGDCPDEIIRLYRNGA